MHVASSIQHPLLAQMTALVISAHFFIHDRLFYKGVLHVHAANIGRWFVHWRASSLLMSTVVANLTAGSVGASRWQAIQHCGTPHVVIGTSKISLDQLKKNKKTKEFSRELSCQ